MSYGVRHTGSAKQPTRNRSSEPANVPLSKPGETNGPSDHSVTSAAVTTNSLVTVLCKKKAPLCGRERQSIVRVCLGSWGEGKQNPDSAVMASVQTEPQCSMARTSRYCVTLRNTVGCSVTLFLTTGHSTLLPSWNLCQQNSHFFSSTTDQICDGYS